MPSTQPLNPPANSNEAENVRAHELRCAVWFTALDAADVKLHDLQYLLRDLELPKYPAGGVVGCAALGRLLDHVVKGQMELRFLERQLKEYRERMSPVNVADEPRGASNP
jgi:hypothetical protein